MLILKAAEFGNSAEQSPEARSGNLHMFTFTSSHLGVESSHKTLKYIFIYINIYLKEILTIFM